MASLVLAFQSHRHFNLFLDLSHRRHFHFACFNCKPARGVCVCVAEMAAKEPLRKEAINPQRHFSTPLFAPQIKATLTQLRVGMLCGAPDALLTDKASVTDCTETR